MSEPLTKSQREALKRELPESQKWREVLKLPLRLDSTSWERWWEIADKMLRAYWKVNPEIQNEDFRRVEFAAESRNKAESKAVAYTKSAFKAIAIANST